MHNLFVNIFKYVPTEAKTPMEDFCTEIFVYIFRQSLEQNPTLALELLKMFGFPNFEIKKISEIKIVTREKHFSNGKEARPDILIKHGDINHVVEVKIGSGLNWYETESGLIVDQIEFYKNINDIKINDVYVLSKYPVLTETVGGKNMLLWSQINAVLKTNENEITKNFTIFLEENGMKNHILNEETENVLGSISAIMQLIDSLLDKKQYVLKDTLERSYIGGYVITRENRNETRYAWVGLVEWEQGYLIIQDEKDVQKSKLDLNKVFMCETEIEKQEVVKKWFDTEFAKILSLRENGK